MPTAKQTTAGRTAPLPDGDDPTDLVITFAFEKATKNTYRFAEVTDDTPVVGTLYVQKSALGVVAEDATLTVTITVD